MGSHRNSRKFAKAVKEVKDAQDTGEFVVNIATFETREQMNASSVSAPREIDEFLYAGLTKENSEIVKCPRVQESPIHLECKFTKSVSLPTDNPSSPITVVFGEVIGVHIKESVITDGKIDMTKLSPIGRLGYLDFTQVTNVFSMDRPVWDSSN